MSIILDLIIVAIVALTIIISAKQGFVRIAVEVAGFIAALILVSMLSGPLADVTYQKVIEPPILNAASDIVWDSTTNTVDSVWENLPDFVTNNADSFGISKEKVKETVKQSSKGDSKAALTKISQDIVKPVVVTIVETFYSVILIMVLLVVVKLLAKLLNKAFSFSVVGKLNTTLGGILGAARGLVIVFFLCKIVDLILPFTQNGIWIFNNENIAKTYIFSFLTNVF